MNRNIRKACIHFENRFNSNTRMSNATVPFVQILRQLFNVVSAGALALSQQYSPFKSNYFTVADEELRYVEAIGQPGLCVTANHPIVRRFLRHLPAKATNNHREWGEPEDSPIEGLMWNPTLFDSVRKPRYPSVLGHGKNLLLTLTMLRQ